MIYIKMWYVLKLLVNVQCVTYGVKMILMAVLDCHLLQYKSKF